MTAPVQLETELEDEAVLTAAVGYFFIAPPGTKAPTATELKTIDLENPSKWTAKGWTAGGHTSRNDMPEFGYDGGDSEVKGTWQRKKLKDVTTDDPIDYLAIFLQEFNERSFRLYYGENASTAPGEFGIAAGGSKHVDVAILVVIQDGDFRIGFHASKATVKRDDAIQLPIDDFGSLPVKATFLQYKSEKLLFKWINELLFNKPKGVVPKTLKAEDETAA